MMLGDTETEFGVMWKSVIVTWGLENITFFTYQSGALRPTLKRCKMEQNQLYRKLFMILQVIHK